MKDNKTWLSIAKAADLIGYSDQTLRNWIKSGKITAYRIGRSWRINRDDLAQMLEESKTAKVPKGDK